MNPFDFSWISDPKAWLGLLTLSFMQLVLGMDNIVLLAVLSGQLPRERQPQARNLGLVVAMISRIALLVTLLWIAHLLEHPFTKIGAVPVSGKTVILFVGGMFLISKATLDIHSRVQGDESEPEVSPAASLAAVLVQIFVLDIVFSLDSVITAIGMSPIIPIQILSVILATVAMMVGIHSIADFIERHPSVKLLALSFLVLIGVNLVAEAAGFDIPRGYTYFAMAWSVLVELLNIRFRHKQRKKKVRQPEPDQAIDPGA